MGLGVLVFYDRGTGIFRVGFELFCTQDNLLVCETLQRFKQDILRYIKLYSFVEKSCANDRKNRFYVFAVTIISVEFW
ncbi:MAG: hypothetical protein RLZZ507_124 [Cyanobacteriota bacterium]